jgi:hypothetical protein
MSDGSAASHAVEALAQSLCASTTGGDLVDVYIVGSAFDGRVGAEAELVTLTLYRSVCVESVFSCPDEAGDELWTAEVHYADPRVAVSAQQFAQKAACVYDGAKAWTVTTVTAADQVNCFGRVTEPAAYRRTAAWWSVALTEPHAGLQSFVCDGVATKEVPALFACLLMPAFLTHADARAVVLPRLVRGSMLRNGGCLALKSDASSTVSASVTVTHYKNDVAAAVTAARHAAHSCRYPFLQPAFAMWEGLTDVLRSFALALPVSRMSAALPPSVSM